MTKYVSVSVAVNSGTVGEAAASICEALSEFEVTHLHVSGGPVGNAGVAAESTVTTESTQETAGTAAAGTETKRGRGRPKTVTAPAQAPAPGPAADADPFLSTEPPAPAPAPVPTPAPAPAPAVAVTVVDVRKVASEKSAVTGKDGQPLRGKVHAIITKFCPAGATASLSAIPADKLAAAKTELEALE